MKYIVGIDDCDSHFGGCTTYVAYKLAKYLIKHENSIKIIPIPNLVRLNPYIPFKTRGNAAVKLVIESDENDKDVLNTILNIVENYREKRGKASPGIALVEYDINKLKILYKLYVKAIVDVVTLDIVENICEKLNIKTVGGRGLVGAVASLGYIPDIDSTFELLIYGNPEIKKSIDIDFKIMKFLDRVYRPYTFSNIDEKREHILIFPTGPDPVIAGIRGDSPIHVISLGSIILNLLKNNLEGWMLYRTNQCTNIHLERRSLRDRSFNPCKIIQIVEEEYRTEDRHLICKTNTRISIFSYRHLGDITTSIEKSLGNIIETWGGLKLKDGEYYVYVEGFRPLSFRLVILRNPKCPHCGHTLKSKGRSRGFYCEKCGKYIKEITKGVIPCIDIKPRIYLPDKSEFRHLMKVLERFGIENFSNIFPEDIPLWII